MEEKELFEQMYYRLFGKSSDAYEQLGIIISRLESVREQLGESMLETEEMHSAYSEQGESTL